ncbi:hypothetical protein [Rathayibacter sp. AY1F9]|uniref:hypothetical protein n=1 Tax=Rathayibacter sp. AY1F9 TaxID=2080563 RepID=UPI000CE720C9|nr:hypothetical protein [Rathayibacter sp. AY1F9]PPH30512.1 hypothetical protein C5C37_04060 [Rathayibacter sp. AY1F9]
MSTINDRRREVTEQLQRKGPAFERPEVSGPNQAEQVIDTYRDRRLFAADERAARRTPAVTEKENQL